MELIKKIIFKILGINGKKKLVLFYKVFRANVNFTTKISWLFKCFFKTKIIKKHEFQGMQFKKLYSKSRIKLIQDELFAYSVDFLTIPSMDKNMSFGNLTVDYGEILDNSLEELKTKYSSNSYYDKNITYLIEGIEVMTLKMIDEVKKSNIKNKKDIINAYNNVLNGKINTTFEAMQKILFYNQLLWQSDVTLIGLGRLDKLLEKYYKNDVKNKIISRNKMKNYVKSFYRILHKDFYLKSGALIGDTGQIIILGGTNNDGSYFCNDLTYIFIEVLKEINLPDPKILLRVNKNIPSDLMKLSLDTICTGVGSPLFANDDIIIPKLKEFGFGDESYNYVTSACWEPFLASKTSDQNNIKSINFAIPFNHLLDKEDLTKFKNVEQILKLYNKYLKEYLNEFTEEVDKFEYNNNCLLSLFYPSCKLKGKDIGEGGAEYNNYGVTSIGMSSVINSLLNIDKIVFNNKELTFNELNKKRKENFSDIKILNKLKENEPSYATDDEQVIKYTNIIIDYTNKHLKNYKNYMGGCIKFGLSSPSYIIDSKNFPATLDGRKNGEPFTVHISSSKVGYTELFNFASKLEYGKLGFNGNVLDFMISPSFIQNNFKKFEKFMTLAIKNGYFETQMNVISSKILIEAKNDSSKFPNLIVRVWGFSTYFNELPEEYKNLLIERAIQNESNGY